MRNGRDLVDLTERMIYLRSIPVAAELPAPVLKVIASYLVERSFPKGGHLMRQDEPFGALQFLIDGKVSLVRNDVAIGQLAPPQSLGFLAILASSDGTYDAKAETDVKSLELDGDALIELMEDHGELLLATLRYLCDRLLYEIKELPNEALTQRFAGDDYPVPNRPLDLVERVVYLRSLRAFARANLNQLAQMAREIEERRAPAGELLWSAGDPSSHSCILLAGSVECRTPDGRSWVAGPRSVVGGLEAIAGHPRWFSLHAKTPIVAFFDPIDAFVGLLEDDFAMARDFISMLAGELVAMLERKAAQGKSTVGVMRDVSNLGRVPVGA